MKHQNGSHTNVIGAVVAGNPCFLLICCDTKYKYMPQVNSPVIYCAGYFSSAHSLQSVIQRRQTFHQLAGPPRLHKHGFVFKAVVTDKLGAR